MAMLLATRGQAAESPAPATRIEKPFLWRIQAPGSEHPSYLFGTIHLSRPEVTNLPLRVLTALHASDAVFTEIPMDPATLVGMSAHLFLQDGKTLADVLPAGILAEAKEAVNAIAPDMPFEPFSRMRIWAFAAALTTLEDQIRHPGALAQDMVIYQRGVLDGKEVGGLESPEEQVAVFEALTQDEQIEMLRDGLQQIRELRAEGQSPAGVLVDRYLRGDIDALAKELDAWFDRGDPKVAAKMRERLLTRRNQIMTDRIIEKLEGNPEMTAFFAVGAAHMHGEDGLLESLRRRGLEVMRAGE